MNGRTIGGTNGGTNGLRSTQRGRRFASFVTVAVGALVVSAGCGAAMHGPGPGPVSEGPREILLLEGESRGYERLLEEQILGAEASDCALACTLGRRICTLADRICELGSRETTMGDRCEDARERCGRARERIDTHCGDCAPEADGADAPVTP